VSPDILEVRIRNHKFRAPHKKCGYPRVHFFERSI
jgi:hypothetical protein